MPKICCKDCVFGLRWSFDVITGIRSREDPPSAFNQAQASAFARFYEAGAPSPARVAKAGITVMSNRLAEHTDIVYAMKILLHARRFCCGSDMTVKRDHEVLVAFYTGCRRTLCGECDQATRNTALTLTVYEIKYVASASVL